MLSHGPIYRIYYNTYIIHLFFDPYKVCLFGLIHNVQVNNFSVMLGRVVLGLTRTKQRIKDTPHNGFAGIWVRTSNRRRWFEVENLMQKDGELFKWKKLECNAKIVTNGPLKD